MDTTATFERRPTGGPVTAREARMELTRTGLRLGIAYIPGPQRLDGSDAQRLQAALLEPRTARPVPRLKRFAGALWGWL